MLGKKTTNGLNQGRGDTLSVAVSKLNCLPGLRDRDQEETLAETTKIVIESASGCGAWLPTAKNQLLAFD